MNYLGWSEAICLEELSGYDSNFSLLISLAVAWCQSLGLSAQLCGLRALWNSHYFVLNFLLKLHLRFQSWIQHFRLLISRKRCRYQAFALCYVGRPLSMKSLIYVCVPKFVTTFMNVLFSLIELDFCLLTSCRLYLVSPSCWGSWVLLYHRWFWLGGMLH